MNNLMITGATGFVGSALLRYLMSSSNFKIRACVRGADVSLGSGVEIFPVGDYSANTNFEAALDRINVVIHTAARVHVMKDMATDPLDEYRRVNVQATLNLARQSANIGVKRFIFISSIKVNGEFSLLGKPFTENDIPAPVDPYGISKKEAEDALRKIASETGMEVIVIRPPLVYGPGVKGNFITLMRWLSKGIPLPFGSIHNKRSFVSIDNLIDLIVICINHPKAANQIFLAGDGEDLSTTDLIKKMGIALGRPARLLPVPEWMLKGGAVLMRKPELALKLCESLQVDISKSRILLGWRPSKCVDDTLWETARSFIINSGK